MIKNFNISPIYLNFMPLNLIYDLMTLHRREEKSKEFLNMALAGVDLKKSPEYHKFINQNIKKEKIEISDEEMSDMKKLSLSILKGGKSG